MVAFDLPLGYNDACMIVEDLPNVYYHSIIQVFTLYSFAGTRHIKDIYTTYYTNHLYHSTSYSAK